MEIKREPEQRDEELVMGREEPPPEIRPTPFPHTVSIKVDTFQKFCFDLRKIHLLYLNLHETLVWSYLHMC